MNNLTKILVASSVGISVPLATLAQISVDFLWPYIGWLATGIYFFLQFFLPLLVPLGTWLKGIVEYVSGFFESSPTPEATIFYILLTVIIIIVAILVNTIKPKPAFVEEFEAKYDRPPDRVK